ncbi:MAG: hypothetical protein WKG01_03260 [Kofleriaceae bacterium]
MILRRVLPIAVSQQRVHRGHRHAHVVRSIFAAEQVIKHHELVLARFALVVPADETVFAAS